VTSTASARGHTVTYITTDKVKQYAREHFGCSDMPGLELEESGGSGTGGSHWDKRLMLNDFMVGDS